MGLVGFCYQFIGDVAQVVSRASHSSSINKNPSPNPNPNPTLKHHVDELALRALKAVFGMDKNGRIKKEQARRVVEKLGLGLEGESEEASFEVSDGINDDELCVEEVLIDMEDDALKQAFQVFDEDGDGFIEASELKRVLECLGLDKGWDMSEIEKMVKVVDLNLDGKVDFAEFELMMGVKSL